MDLIPPLTNELIQSYYTSPVSAVDEAESHEDVSHDDALPNDAPQDDAPHDDPIDQVEADEKTDSSESSETPVSPAAVSASPETETTEQLSPPRCDASESTAPQSLIVDGKEVKVSDILLRSRYTRPLLPSDQMKNAFTAGDGRSGTIPIVSASSEDFLKSVANGSIPTEEEIRKRYKIPADQPLTAPIVPIFVPVVIPVYQNNPKETRQSRGRRGVTCRQSWNVGESTVDCFYCFAYLDLSWYFLPSD